MFTFGAGASSDLFFCRAMGAGREFGGTASQPQIKPAVLVRPSRTSQQILPAVSRPAVVGEAVLEPLSRRSVEYQMETRAILRSRLSRIFSTLDTPRGLIVNIPASLLSSGSGLPRDTSENLAKVAEMLPPDVDVRVEGYTDDRGSASRTLLASCGLAEAVRNVLEQNDTSPREITATGFVSNAVSKLHDRRCVQIVIAGRGIGRSTPMAGKISIAHKPAVNRGRSIFALNTRPHNYGRR